MIRMAVSAEAYEAVVNAPKRPPCIVTYETTPDGEYVVGMVEEIWLNKLRTLGEKDYSVGIERLVAPEPERSAAPKSDQCCQSK